MGEPMVANLIKAGWRVVIYDTDSARTNTWHPRSDAALHHRSANWDRCADVVLLMLPDGKVVRKVVLGNGGNDSLRAGLAEGKIIVI